MEVTAAALDSEPTLRFLPQGKFQVLLNTFWISPGLYSEELLNLSKLYSKSFPLLFILNDVYPALHPETAICAW